MHEDDAQAAFALAIGVPESHIENVGLVVSAEKGYLAMSPDGVLHTSTGPELIEFKCPWGCRYLEEERDVLQKGSMYPRKLISGAMCGVVPIPPYYFTQVQHGMSVLSSLGKRFTRAHFVVWCPSKSADVREIARSPDGSRIVSTPKGTVQLTVVERDDAYIARMYERVDKMWDKYVAACVWRDCQCLNEPDLTPSLDLDV